jgi:hypothetical protein
MRLPDRPKSVKKTSLEETPLRRHSNLRMILLSKNTGKTAMAPSDKMTMTSLRIEATTIIPNSMVIKSNKIKTYYE